MSDTNIRRFIESIIGPSIVGLVVLLGQFCIQPLIEERQFQKKELLRLKQASYIEAITILNEYSHLIRIDKAKNPSDDDQANNVMAKLVLLSDDKQISESFWGILFYKKKENDNFKDLFEYREALIRLMRQDIGKHELKEDKH